MHLSNKDFLKLLLPFILSFLIYNFNNELIYYAKYIFVNSKTYSQETLDKRVGYYLKIKNYKTVFTTILSNIKKREKNILWITDHLLYKYQKHPLNNTTKTPKTMRWILKAVFPQQKVAIINEKVIYINSKIGTARVVQIKKDKVLLKTHKGFKWIYLFQ
jgi:hypothetical protein